MRKTPGSRQHKEVSAVYSREFMQEIVMSNGAITTVDDEDFESLNQYRWFVDDDGYAARNETSSLGKREKVRMHRQIMGLALHDPRKVDHRNLNRLHNVRGNLRICTNSQNLCNRGAQANNTTGRKGVSWSKQSKRFHARIKVGDKNKHLGSFLTVEAAYAAYCAAAKIHHGEFANVG